MKWWSKLQLKWERDSIYRELADLNICRKCGAEISALSAQVLCESCLRLERRSKRDELFERLKKLDGENW